MKLSMTLDDKAVQGLVDALPRQIFNAQRSAIGTTTTYARKELERRMILQTRIPPKVFRRVRIKAKRYRESGLVWLGYNPVKASYVGKLRQSKNGAFAGRHFFEGGFVARMQSGHVGIYKRKGQSRLPIAEQTVDLGIGIDVAEEVYGLAQRELRARFISRVKQLNPNLE